jgi:DNA replication and repair protein RecF
MTITSARLQNFRSYVDSSFEFEPHVNIIVGPNASGKTNLLDALYFIAQGGSMRPKSDHIIHEQEQWARVDVLTNTNQSRVLKITQQESAATLLIDDKKYKRLPLDQRIPVVLFEPSQLYLITSSPDMRRQLMDSILDKSVQGFTTLKNNYTRVLRQRNSLLKQPLPVVKQQIFAWDLRLSELAGQYVEKRLELLQLINQKISDIYSSIAAKPHTLSLEYVSKLSAQSYANSLHAKLEQRLELDHMRGFTGYGPHRDDIGLLIDGKDVRDVASRGETRSILLSLKIIEAQILETAFGNKPILLLDDVFGELDGVRRKSLIEFMATNQTFITTTDADVIGHDFAQKSKLLSVV